MAELPKYFYFRVKTDGLTIQLEDASDADVVEVVRCAECKFAGALKDDKLFDCHCGLWWDAVYADGYCSSGVRRDEPIFPITVADVVEVVRCKDCREYYTGMEKPICTLLGLPSPADFFCAGGMKRGRADT